ncbi:MAG: sulfite exporter TauE/SafE family protein [Phreatobacter sp.]|uniref:sulfite exporter TauE/SafE family protein n=1 Tax=Phreatobacter sp. TaxID=1966341 RepID=UPI001A425E2E|nr:sulfite exporter TauE/SafE family protein [Phreatobacter sp.]MBL8571844.1 sulfite exporter TauE/SafE family protein [Phreatobacter sp.]
MSIDFVLLLLGSFAGGFASGLSGFAFALIASATFLHVLPPTDSTTLVLLGSIVAQFFTIWRLRHAMDARRLAPFLIGGIVGVPFGTWALQHVSVGRFRDAIGSFLIAYSSYSLWRGVPRVLAWGGRAADGAVGVAGGFLGGLAGLSGSLPTIWCGFRGWPRDEQRAVYQPFVVLVQLLGFAALALAGGVTVATLWLFLQLLPAMLLGVWTGMTLYQRIDEQGFRRVVLLLLMASGLMLVLW